MPVEDYYPNGKRWWVRLREKGGTLENGQWRRTKARARRSSMIEDQLAEAMETQGISKLEMAARVRTSRRQPDRF